MVSVGRFKHRKLVIRFGFCLRPKLFLKNWHWDRFVLFSTFDFLFLRIIIGLYLERTRQHGIRVLTLLSEKKVDTS